MERTEQQQLVIALLTAERARDPKTFTELMNDVEYHDEYPLVSEICALANIVIDALAERNFTTPEAILTSMGLTLQS